jgi:hypothetical protein
LRVLTRKDSHFIYYLIQSPLTFLQFLVFGFLCWFDFSIDNTFDWFNARWYWFSFLSMGLWCRRMTDNKISKCYWEDIPTVLVWSAKWSDQPLVCQESYLTPVLPLDIVFSVFFQNIWLFRLQNSYLRTEVGRFKKIYLDLSSIVNKYYAIFGLLGLYLCYWLRIQMTKSGSPNLSTIPFHFKVTLSNIMSSFSDGGKNRVSGSSAWWVWERQRGAIYRF